MTQKRAQEILKAFRAEIRPKMLDSLLPIHRATGAIKPSEFLEALTISEELLQEYNEAKRLLRDMMIMESISMYHSEKGSWAAKNIKLKVDAIEKIVKMMDDFGPQQQEEIVVTYADEVQ